MSRHDPVIIALLILGGVLLLAHLDNGVLWQDEAETALLARHTLTFGYPRACDERNCLEEPLGYGRGQTWIYHPWLTFYVLAGVFAVLGESTWTARLPFALLGWLNLGLVWRLACRLTEDRRIHRLSVALLALSVPFLLSMRQCRYYALTTALLLGVCLAYLSVLRRPSLKALLALGVALTLLFYTNFGTFLPTLGAVIVHQARWGTRAMRFGVMVTLALVIGLTLPWALVAYRPGFLGEPSVERVYRHLEYYVRITNKHLIPLAALAVLSWPWLAQGWGWLGGAWRRLWSAPDRSWLILLVVLHVGFLVVPNQRHLRYLMPLVPLLAVGEAWWLAAWQRRSRVLGSVFAALILFTNVLQSPHARVPLADFLYELTHPIIGPMDGVVAYLRAHGQPDQVAKIPYDDRTLMFYTPLRVEPPSQFLRETDPDWVIIRRGWIPPQFFESPSFRRMEASYERVELDAPDTYWQNREDPGEHHFRTVRDAPPRRDLQEEGAGRWVNRSCRSSSPRTTRLT